MNRERALHELHQALGYKRLTRGWAKVEIVLGLSAAGCGLLLPTSPLVRSTDWATSLGSLLLFVLGAYLAMAGHRSHLYQSSNERAAYLAELIRAEKASA